MVGQFPYYYSAFRDDSNWVHHFNSLRFHLVVLYNILSSWCRRTRLWRRLDGSNRGRQLFRAIRRGFVGTTRVSDLLWLATRVPPASRHLRTDLGAATSECAHLAVCVLGLYTQVSRYGFSDPLTLTLIVMVRANMWRLF